MKKIKAIAVSIITAALIAAIVLILFDFYKFYKLETFSKAETDNICITMSQLNNGTVKKSVLTEDNRYTLCLVKDNDRCALFIIEKVYFHGIKKLERYKIKYENIDNENSVSSLSFHLDNETDMLIYYWNDSYSVKKADYCLVDNNSNETFKKSAENISENYLCIKYLYKNYSVTKINFYDSSNNLIYSEERAVSDISNSSSYE